MEVLLDKHLPFNRIATCQPVGVQDNLVFVIDLSQLEEAEDIRADDLGSWTCNGNDVCSVLCMMEKCQKSYLDPKVEPTVPTALSNGITSTQQLMILREQLLRYMVSFMSY